MYLVFVCLLFWIAFCTLKLQFTLSCCLDSSVTVSYKCCQSVNLNAFNRRHLFADMLLHFNCVSFCYVHFINCSRTYLRKEVSLETRCLTKCLPFPAFWRCTVTFGNRSCSSHPAHTLRENPKETSKNFLPLLRLILTWIVISLHFTSHWHATKNVHPQEKHAKCKDKTSSLLP